MSQMQPTFPRQNPGPDLTQQQPTEITASRWDAILAERHVGSYASGNGNSYQRGGSGFSGNYNNRHNRDNNGSGYGGYSGRRENNYGRRDQEFHKTYHSHVGSQSSDMSGADWSTPLPSNANIER